MARHGGSTAAGAAAAPGTAGGAAAASGAAAGAAAAGSPLAAAVLGERERSALRCPTSR